MTNDKKPRGGKRPNSGAKPKYGEATVNITTRVPESKVEPFRQNAKEFLEQFKVNPLKDYLDDDVGRSEQLEPYESETYLKCRLCKSIHDPEICCQD